MDINNMLRKLIPYNIEARYIKGSSNDIPDFLSRRINSKAEAPEFEVDNPSVLYRSRAIIREGLDTSDPWLETIGEAGAEDQEYQEIIEAAKDKEEIPDDSAAKQIEGIMQDISIVKLKSGKEIAVKSGSETLIPESLRKELLTRLHSTHMSTAEMKRLSRGKFFWKNINRDIEEKYKQCKECAKNSIRKMEHKAEVPPQLTYMAPNEELSVDFADIGGHDVLVIKDRLSGWISAFRTRNKKTESACEALEDHFYEFGLPDRESNPGLPRAH